MMGYPGMRYPYGRRGRPLCEVPSYIRRPRTWLLWRLVVLAFIAWAALGAPGVVKAAEPSAVSGMYQIRLSTYEWGPIFATIRAERWHTVSAQDCSEVQRVMREAFAEYQYFDYFGEAYCGPWVVGGYVAAIVARKGVDEYYIGAILEDERVPGDIWTMSIEDGSTIAVSIMLLLAGAWVARQVIRAIKIDENESGVS